MSLRTSATPARPDFRARLNDELLRRRRVNRRYSLRAFGEFLAVDHSTLSQILRGRRAVPAGCVRLWGTKLGLGPEEIELYSAAEQAEDFASLDQGLRRLQWMAEAAALLSRESHWEILRLLREPDWRPDVRWIAGRSGTAIDDLNDAIARLLRLGLLSVGADGVWRDCSGCNDAQAPTAERIREVALAKLRLVMSGS